MSDLNIGLPPPQGATTFGLGSLQGLNKEEYDQAVNNIADNLVAKGVPFSKDTLVDWIKTVDQAAVLTNKDAVLYLDPKSPFPDIPRATFMAKGTFEGNSEFKAESTSEMGAGSIKEPVMANKWFKANPQVAYIIAFGDLISALKELKMVEAETKVNFMNQSWELAKDMAQSQKDIARLEANMEIAAAVNAGVQGAVAVTAGAAAIGMGGIAAAKAGPTTTTGTPAGGTSAGTTVSVARGAPAPGPATAAPAPGVPAAAPGVPAGGVAAAPGGPAIGAGATPASNAAAASSAQPKPTFGESFAQGFQRFGSGMHQGAAISQTVMGFGKFGDAAEHALKAAWTLEKGKEQAELEMQRGMQQIVQEAMQSASKDWDSTDQALAQAIQKMSELMHSATTTHNLGRG